jgi:predicted ester cyclase
VRRWDAEAFYRHYLAVCNAHAFDRLGGYVAADIEVNGVHLGLPAYTAGLRATVRAFPDYHWQLRDLLIDGDRIAARLTDTGTHEGEFLGVPATGRKVYAQEISIYHLAADRIARVWVTADNLTLLDQLR